MFVSTADAAGPRYFVVSTPVPKAQELMKRSYLQSVFTYQANAIHEFLVKDKQHAPTVGISAPAYQIAPYVRRKTAEFVRKLEPFAYLTDGWNGQGSKAPTVFGLWHAVVDSYMLIAVGWPTPEPKVLGDGTLGVFWEKGEAYATIDFEEDGVHLWTVTDGRDFKSGTWNAAEEAPPNFRVMEFEQSAWGREALPMSSR